MDRIRELLDRYPGVSDWIWLGVNTVIAVIVVFVLLKIEKKIATKLVSKRNDIHTLFREKLIRFVIIFVAFQWVIMSSNLTRSFGSSLFQGTAVLAAIAGFAAKPILTDMFCGFMISTTKPFNIGDRIELDDGTAGIVKDITIRHVVLQGVDTMKYVIPNSEINSRRITNMSFETRVRSIHFRFLVGLNSKVEQVKNTIADAINDSPYSVPRSGEEYSPVYFYQYQPSGIEMAVTVYYLPTSPTEVVRDDINCRVNRALNAAGIEIPYDYMNVIMTGQKEEA